MRGNGKRRMALEKTKRPGGIRVVRRQQTCCMASAPAVFQSNPSRSPRRGHSNVSTYALLMGSPPPKKKMGAGGGSLWSDEYEIKLFE